MITSPRNPKVAAAARLRKRALRDGSRRFLIEGAQAVAEAIAGGSALEQLFFTPSDRVDTLVERAREHGTPLLEVSDAVMERLTSTVTPQGLVGVGAFIDVPLASLPSATSLWVVLCAGRDPGNAGTVLRSADAAGADAVIFADSSVDLYNPKTVRASAGSLFHVPVVREVAAPDAVAAARSRGMAVYAMAGDGGTDLFSLDLTRPSAFLVGNEAWGLPEGVRALADATVRIPIAGRAESLNMAAAASVCVFEAARQRAAGSGSERMDAIVAGAAHDIRSPLTAARNMASVLLRTGEKLGAEDREAILRGIVRDTEETDAILRQLVDASRIVGRRLEVAPSDVGIADLAKRVAERAAFDPDHPPVVWDGAELSVVADGLRVEQAIGAFVQAALWWGAEGPIHVGAHEEKDAVVVEVSRAGAAISARDVEALFVPRRPGSGSGSKIGLFVARGVAEAHGGGASARVDDAGVHFRLELPR